MRLCLCNYSKEAPMFAKKIPLGMLIIGILLILTACNFPGSNPEPTLAPDMIYTAAAQTLTAQETEAALGTPIARRPSIASPEAAPAAARSTPNARRASAARRARARPFW